VLRNLDDHDELEEEERVARCTSDEMEIRTHLLNKIYKSRTGNLHAVKNISFGINFGE